MSNNIQKWFVSDINGTRIEEIPFKTVEPTVAEWKRFVNDGMTNWSEEHPYNVKHDFTKMTKLFGKSYLFWLEIEYNLWKLDGGDIEEILKLSGNVPMGFMKRFE